MVKKSLAYLFHQILSAVPRFEEFDFAFFRILQDVIVHSFAADTPPPKGIRTIDRTVRIVQGKGIRMTKRHRHNVVIDSFGEWSLEVSIGPRQC